MMRERRLFIESIIVENFKSYKGKHVIGPFGRGFNSIVGPNGSGKSNVIDAVLFVLGFKAKKMRHTKAENLIYAGETNADEAEVTINFVTQENEQIHVTRSVTKKGKSLYYLNHEPETLERVTELLKSYNVDLVNNRFMILQGEIESVSNMKPKGTADTTGLLEYLEEIIGTNAYIEEIEKKEKEVEREKEKKERVYAEYKFLEKEMEYMQPKAEAAREEISMYIGAVERRLTVIQQEIDQEKEKCVKEKETQKEIEKEKNEAENILNEKNQKMKDTNTIFEKKKNDLRKREAGYLEAKKEYERVDTIYRKAAALKEIYHQKKQALEEEKEKRDKEKECLKKQQKEYIEEENENKQQIKRAIEERDILKAQVEKMEKSVTKKLATAASKAEKNLFEHVQLLKAQKDKERSITKEKKEIEKKLERTKNIISTIPAEIEKIKEKAKTYDEKKYISAQEKLKEIIKAKEETFCEHARRELLLSDLQKEASTSAAGDKLAILNTVKGYYGRVRDLGTIPDKYTMALSAVAKGAVNNLVVDRTETAEKCLDIIKSRSLGRYTILVLDRIGEKVPVSTASNRLIDKIKTKPVFLPCFYHIIGETLVVNNIDAAMKRAFAPDRPKVVTLDGKVIERSGLMSGGAVRLISLSQKRSPAEIRKELESAQQLVAEAEKGIHIMNDALEKAEAQIDMLRMEKIEQERSVAQIKSLEQRLQQAKEEEQKQKPLQKRAQVLAAHLEECQAEIQKIIEKETQLEKIKKDAEKEIEKASGSEYKVKKAQLQGIEEQIAIFEERNFDLKKKAEIIPPSTIQIEKNLEEINKKIEEIDLHPPEKEEKQLAQAERLFRDAKIESEAADRSRIEMHREIDILQTKILSIDERRMQIQEILQQTEKKINELEKECIILQEKDNLLTKKLGEYRKAIGVETGDQKLLNISADALIAVYLEYEEKRKICNKEKQVLQEREEEEQKEIDALYSLKEKRTTEFIAGLKKINSDLRSIYSLLTFGGNAELELVDYLDPFSEGVVMSVMPPRKSWKSVAHLSGGERTLSSLSLIFALHEFHPNSFYVMDEIDAALDYKNVEIVGRFISEKAKECQFLVISLRENMYELASVFIGVYKPADTTLSLAINATSADK